MSKQTSIEWLFVHLIPHLDWSKVEQRELFRKLKEEAKQMHKEEIIEAYYQSAIDNFEHIKLTKRFPIDYYNEKYEVNNENI